MEWQKQSGFWVQTVVAQEWIDLERLTYNLWSLVPSSRDTHLGSCEDLVNCTRYCTGHGACCLGEAQGFQCLSLLFWEQCIYVGVFKKHCLTNTWGIHGLLLFQIFLRTQRQDPQYFYEESYFRSPLPRPRPWLYWTRGFSDMCWCDTLEQSWRRDSGNFHHFPFSKTLEVLWTVLLSSSTL